jgi:hypothetical protein
MVKAESAVKIAKPRVTKAMCGKPFSLCFGSSPVQSLMSRRTRSLLPTAPKLLAPKVIGDVQAHKRADQDKSKHYYDQHAKHLPVIKQGQALRVLLSPHARDVTWSLGTCIGHVSARSYEVEVKGRKYRRKRKDIRPVQESIGHRRAIRGDWEDCPLGMGTMSLKR